MITNNNHGLMITSNKICTKITECRQKLPASWKESCKTELKVSAKIFCTF